VGKADGVRVGSMVGLDEDGAEVGVTVPPSNVGEADGFADGISYETASTIKRVKQHRKKRKGKENSVPLARRMWGYKLDSTKDPSWAEWLD
jgi:hypothetical protein